MNNKILYIIIALLIVIIAIGLFLFLGNRGDQKEIEESNLDKEMVDCGEMQDLVCFGDRMNECLPVTAKLTGTDGSAVEMTILGIENDKCHFQRKVNGALNLNCFFPKGTMDWNTIDQTFGNDKGLQKLVDDSCKSGW